MLELSVFCGVAGVVKKVNRGRGIEPIDDKMRWEWREGRKKLKFKEKYN